MPMMPSNLVLKPKYRYRNYGRMVGGPADPSAYNANIGTHAKDRMTIAKRKLVLRHARRKFPDDVDRQAEYLCTCMDKFHEGLERYFQQIYWRYRKQQWKEYFMFSV